jgi:hypothetical protein
MIDRRSCGDDCWNKNAVDAYLETTKAKEERLAANPDIEVIAGRLSCQGCIVNIHRNGTMCSIQITETQFAVVGERLPSKEDAFVTASSVISGFKMIKPGSGDWAEPVPAES